MPYSIYFIAGLFFFNSCNLGKIKILAFALLSIFRLAFLLSKVIPLTKTLLPINGYEYSERLYSSIILLFTVKKSFAPVVIPTSTSAKSFTLYKSFLFFISSKKSSSFWSKK